MIPIQKKPMKSMYSSQILMLFFLIAMVSCKEEREGEKIKVKDQVILDTIQSGINSNDFTETLNGKPVSLYVLKNTNGIEAVFTNYGQRLVSLMVPDRNGIFKDIVLGYGTLAEYQVGNSNYFGSVIGRYGNRIAKGKFELDGMEYSLATNNNENHLHGGIKGFESVVWQVDSIAKNYIRFQRTSPDMEEGYPGNLDVRVDYLLTDTNDLRISYSATTDKKTHINLTNHSYFNLKGAGEGDITDHIVQINSERYTPVDDGLIPTGEFANVANTPFDFSSPKVISEGLESKHPQIKIGKGYDQNFILNTEPKNKAGLVFTAKVIEPNSGRVLEVYTDQPGVQFYSGNFLDSVAGKNGKIYPFRGAFCLETQHYPNSPNKKDFPSTVLIPGETYKSHTAYSFRIK